MSFLLRSNCRRGPQTILWVAAAALLIAALAAAGTAAQEEDWRSDWFLQPGFVLEIDALGFNLPTSIAFVPDPGPAGDDALYFVTELNGALKVVTNDRSVHTFADGFFRRSPPDEFPFLSGEVGMAGLCLAPDEGYVFVTFAYHDENGVVRNNIVRFESEPGVYALSPERSTDFVEIFLEAEGQPSHQIGPCQVSDGALYVAVGDGRDSEASRDIDSVLGKVLRMDLDGNPLETNPFYQDTDRTMPRNYVWAYGLRNPFGLKFFDGRLFAADNGPSTDRFVEIVAGRDYLYDDTDFSMGTAADIAIPFGDGVAQLDHTPLSSSPFPEQFAELFFLVITGNTKPEPEGLVTGPGIYGIEYSLAESRALSVPDKLLDYRGEAGQALSSLAFGPDGLYLAPLLPNAEGDTPVYRIRYDPANTEPTFRRITTDPIDLMREYGCFGCHLFEKYEGGTAGPRLDRTELNQRLDERLHSRDYRDSLAAVDALEREPFTSFQTARQELIELEGQARIELWLKYHLLEPRFDNPNSAMPNLGLSEKEAAILADFLATAPEPEPEEQQPVEAQEAAAENVGPLDRLRGLLPQPFGLRDAGAVMLVGFVFGVSAAVLGYAAIRFLQSRRAS